MRRAPSPIASGSSVSGAVVMIVALLTAISTGCAGHPERAAVLIDPSRIEQITKTFTTTVDLPPLIKPPIAHPDYPDYAMRHPRPGMVLLKIDIDAQGRVTSVEVIESTNLLLESSARQAALQWSFEPARRNNLPVPATIVVPVEFTQGEH